MSSYRTERCGAGASYATAGETCRAGIVLDALSAGYGQTLIVDDINLTIPTGKMTVLAGRTDPANPRCSRPSPEC